MKTRLLFVASLLLTAFFVRSQPIITSFTPTSGPIGTTVTITGTNFSAIAANNIVYFGAVRASVIGAATTELEVTVPAGAMYQPISVTVGGLKGYSAKPFVVTFNGLGIDANSFATGVNFTTGVDPAFLAVGDLDGDGKLDVAVPNYTSNTTTSVFRNLSTGMGSADFTAKNDLVTEVNPIAAFIGDIDGDGLPDLIVANYGSNSYSVFRNTSTSGTISFASKVDIAFAGVNPYEVTVGDIDGDGKADVVAANYGNRLSIYRNTGSVGTISFAAKVDYTVPQPNSLALNDLDGDGRLDIAVASISGNIAAVFRNTSTPGSVSLATRIDLPSGTQPRSIVSGDVDGDGKADLAVANGGSGTVSIFRNTSTVGSLSFDPKTDVSAGLTANPYSVSMGDIDGDGKVDLATANVGTATISVFKNNSTSGSISLATKQDFATGITPRCVFIADHDGDGRADLTVANFGSDSFSVLLNAIKSPQSIAFGALATKTFGDAPFTISATASSSLPASFVSDNTAVATVAGDVVTIVGAGTCNITATQAGNSYYAAASNVPRQLVVNKANQAITFGGLTNVSMGDSPFTLTATSNSALTVSYTSSNTAVATISGKIVTIVGVGSTTITASQVGNANYNPATDVQQTLTVGVGNQTISFANLPDVAFGDPSFALSATTSSGLAVSYTSSDVNVATVIGSTVTIIGVGSTTITASQGGNVNFNAAADVQQVLTVNKADQTIAFGTLTAKTFGDPAFTLAATASSTLAVSYTSSNTAVATISGSTITVVGAGTTIITASQAGDTNYNPAMDVQQMLTVNKADQTVTFGALDSQTFGDAPFTLTASASSSLGVTFASSNTAIATIAGNTVTIVGAGTATITATQAGDANYNTASAQQILTVAKASQTVSFASLPTKTFGDASFNITATATSSLAVEFSSSNTSVATISGNTVTIVGAGATTIVASQPGDTNFDAATGVAQTFTVDKANQTISFGLLTAKQAGDVFTLSATASSALPVSYTSNDPAIAEVVGNTVTVLAVGTVTITASQGGNQNYNAAADAQQTLAVNKGNQTITFNPLVNKTYGDADFSLAAISSSTLDVSYTSSNTSVATISGNTVTIVGAGTTTITASQSGDVNYNAAVSVDQILTIDKANQTITFNALPAKSEDDPSFQLTATASSGLPVSYGTDNASVAIISGTSVTIMGGGTATIFAFQDGDANYNAASFVSQLLIVKFNQVITFEAIADKTLGDAPFTLSAVSSKSLPVSYNSSNTSVATINGSTLTIVGAGTTTITASQAGDASYNAAADVSQILTVNRISQTITFGVIADKTMGDAAFSVTAVASSSLPVSFSTASTTIAINGSQVTIVSAGRATITAAQVGDANYNAAASVDRSFCIKPAKPSVTVSNLNTESPILTSSAPAGNQWYRNDILINGATNTTFSVTEEGVYKVQVTVDDCVSEFSNDQTLVVTDLEGESLEQIGVSPNPANDWIEISFGSVTGVKKLQVMELSGREVESREELGNSARLNIASYASGIYLLKVRTQETLTTIRFVKK